MVNVYLSGSDARNAAADLWQSDQLKRLNDQFAPPPADTAQPLPSAPVEAAGDQGSSLPSPSAAGPAMTQPAPPAAVPAPVPVLPAAPNPTPDRNDLADHFTRNAVADAWEQNAISDVTKGVNQAGQGVQSALADVPKEAQGLVSNLSALPGASAGIPAPQPTQGQVATVAGGQPPMAGSVQAATATTAGISGGGDLSGRIGDRGMQIMASGAQAASWLGGEGQKALQAVLLTEGGLAGARGDQGKSAGPLQFYEGGQLANFAQQMGLGLEQAKQYVEAHPEAAIQWAIGTPDRPGYLGGAIQAGLKAGLQGADLATYAQQHGQVSVSPERAGQNWQSLFGSGQTAVAQVGGDQQMASAQPIARPADDWLAIAKEQLGKPYIWGSAGGRSTFDPNAPGFDCSGFVSYVMKKAFGVDLPAFTGTAYTATRPLQEGETPGAAGQVAFYNMGQSDPHLQHIALSIGDGKVIQAGGRRNDVNTDVANDIGTPEWRVPVGIPGKLADAAQQVVGAGAAAAQTGQNVQQAVQQTAQGLISTVGNVGSAIGTTASNIGGALNSPALPGQIYQNSPIGVFNTGLQQVGSAAGQIGSALGLQNPLDAAQTYTQIQQKYGGGLQPTPSGGMTWRPPDYSQMTPEDQAAMTNATMAIGGVIGEPGMPKPGGGAARGLPPNEALGPSGPQPGQLPLGTEFGQELPHGGPPPPAGGYEAPNVPQSGQLQLGSELPYGGQPPPAGGYQAPNVPQPGQLQFESELPLGNPRSSLPPSGPLGPAERQPGQMGLGVGEQYQQDLLAPRAGPFETPNVPTPAQTPEQADYLRRAMTYRALTEGTPLPDIPYQGATAQNLVDAPFSRPGAANQQSLPGVKSTFQLTKGNPVFQALGEGKQTIFSLTNFHTLTIGEGTLFGPGGPSAAWEFLRAYNPFGGQGYTQGRMAGDLEYWFRRAQANGVTLLEGATNPEVGAVGGLSPVAQIGARSAGGAVTGFATGYKSTQVAGGTDEEALRNGLISGAVGAVLGPTVAQSLHQALWGRAVPLAKVLTFKAAVEGGAPAVEASKFANNLAGGQNLRNIADSPWIANALRLVATAPDWLISQFRLAGAGLAGTAKSVPGVSNIPGVGAMTANEQLSRDFLLKAVGTGLFATELLQKGLTGHFTNENEPGHQFQVELPTGKLDGRGLPENTTISLFPGNVQGLLDLAARRDPGAFIHGRVSPALGLTADLLKNTDYRGKPIVEPGTSAIQAFPQEAAYVASRYAPIGIAAPEQQIQQGAPPGLVAASALTGLKIGHDTASAALFAQRDQIVAQGWPSMADQIKKSDAYRNSPPARQSQMLADAHRSLTNQAMVLTDPQGIGAYMTPAPQGQVNPALGLLASAGVPVPASPPQTINYNGRQVQLSPQEQQMRQQTLAQRLEQSMAGYVKSEKFQTLPPEQQYKALEPVVKSATQYADQRVIAAMTPEDRKARLAMAPLAHSAAAMPYVGSGGSGLAAIIAQQSGADAAAAHQRLLDQYSSIAPQLTPTAAPAR